MESSASANRTCAPGRSLNAEGAAVDAVFTVARPALDLEAALADEEAEEERVGARAEVGLERELVIIHDHVARQPQRHGVLPFADLVVAVVATLEAVDVDEHLPLALHAAQHLEVRTHVVLLARRDVVDELAGR